ncbi:MAG TPA: HlyD family efflux transporter periplasmic adaptor subunit [Saprospiraceae bacterium]|nr:HlyD family efflux transporter periplasmic adaptor subunit [Saprospiraceae bacterium]
MKLFIIGTFFISSISFIACKSSENNHDASGIFEANEVIVSSEVSGKILNLNIEEGMTILKDSVIGKIDPINLQLQTEQVSSSMAALRQKTNDADPQIQVLETQITAQQKQLAILNTQLNTAIREQKRIQNLVKAEAAPAKQLDDVNAQVDLIKDQIEAANSQLNVLKRQIVSQKEMVGIQNRSILSEQQPLEKKLAQMKDQLSKTNITNPIAGTVLTKYANAGEITVPGKAIYKIADLSYVTLRIYITGTQIPQIKLNQTVKVAIDEGEKKYKNYEGTITWISDKAEFTPKTIQTKEERANLVYPVKIRVKNDGYLKLGMYGEVNFK